MLRNSGALERKPKRIQGTEFEEFLTAAEIAAHSNDERIRYEKDMVTAQDMHNALVFARAEGRKEGREEGRQEGQQEGIAEGEARGIEKADRKNREEKIRIARTLKAAGLDFLTISKAVGMTAEEIAKL